MWVYKRMLRMERVRNTEVMERLNKQNEILFSIKKRELKYFRHVIREKKYRLVQIGEDNRKLDCRRIFWLKNLRN